ncbi:MAG: Fibronectin type III protein [uncultured bacterium]|nr:MAG: Fibronectin type III protein [uncultured bacterium]
MIPARSKIIFSAFIAGLILALTSHFQSVHATTKTFKSIQDASVRSKETSNNINGTVLEVAYNEIVFFSDDIRRSYVKFDISSIPDNATVNSAKLRLNQKSHTLTDNAVTIDIIRLIGDWSETGVKWSNKPGNYAPTVSKSVTKSATWVEWTITNTVKGWVDGTYPNKGLEISGKNLSSDYLLTFSSREGDKDPELVVDYDVPFDFNVIIPPINFDDTTKPVISEVKVESITDTSAKITWTTDEDSDGFVDYDTDSSYDKKANGEQDTKDHEITLYDLQPDTKYHYRVRAKDATGNEAQTSDKTFTTAKQDELTGAPSEDANQTAPVDNTNNNENAPAPEGTTQTSNQETETNSEEEPMNSSEGEESTDTQKPTDGKYVKVEDLINVIKVAGLGLAAIGLLALGILLGKKFGSKDYHEKHTEPPLNTLRSPHEHSYHQGENERNEPPDENR